MAETPVLAGLFSKAAPRLELGVKVLQTSNKLAPGKGFKVFYAEFAVLIAILIAKSSDTLAKVAR